jgi:hypothetical protein
MTDCAAAARLRNQSLLSAAARCSPLMRCARAYHYVLPWKVYYCVVLLHTCTCHLRLLLLLLLLLYYCNQHCISVVFSACVTSCEHALPRALQTLAYCCHQLLLCAPSLPSFRLLRCQAVLVAAAAAVVLASLSANSCSKSQYSTGT